VAAIAFVAVDAADRDTCKLFEIGDGGAESMAIIWIAVQRLGMKHELPALGWCCAPRRDFELPRPDMACEKNGF
jgi:hypothetical protein